MRKARAVMSVHLVFFAAVLLAVFGTSPLTAQARPDDGMAFPRDILTWYLAGDAERVWERAGPMLREMAGNAASLRENAAEIKDSMGAETAVLGEQVFDHEEGDGWKVYVRTARHANLPEIFWVVIFSPENRLVQMIMPQPRQTIRTLFPQVRLP